jgi:hypothetical protein
MMFDSAMTPDEINSNFSELFGGNEALKWATGQLLDRDALVKGTLSSKYGTGALDTSRRSRKTMSGFLGSQNKTFNIGADELSGNLTLSRI